MSQTISFLSPKLREIRAKFIVTGFNASYGFMKRLVSIMCKELKASNVTPEFEVLAGDMFVETRQLRQKGDFRMISPRTYEAMFNCCEKNRFHRL